MKYILLSFFLLLTIGCSLFQKKHTIAFTHNSNGHLLACECSIDGSGGLDRRMTVFDAVRKADSEAIFLDAGDLFSTTNRFPIKDYHVSVITDVMSYDAIALGDQDFIHGLTWLNDNKRSLPFISGNIFGFWKSAKVIKRKNEHIAIISLIEPNFLSTLPDSTIDALSPIPPEAILPNLLAQFDSLKVKNIILLSHLGWENDLRLAETYPQLSLIISGHDQDPRDSLKVVNKTPIVQTGPDGERVGLLSGYFSEGKFVIKDYSRLVLNKEVKADSLIYHRSKRYEAKGEN